ncbi:zinc finger, CCHC-type containing protein [Tanacetum coccineum]
MEDGPVLYTGDDHFAHVYGKESVVLEFNSGQSITSGISTKGDTASSDKKPSSPRSKQSATKQRRRSKINDMYILKENKDKKDAKFNERFKHRPPKALDEDETEFLDTLELSRRQHEHQVADDEAQQLRSFQKQVAAQSASLYELEEILAVVPKVQETDIQEKDEKQSQKRQNQARDGKDKVKSKPKAAVRNSDSKRKFSSEKGIDCIFVGYAEHSKEYRFYAIVSSDSVSINTIIQSRDAISDENHFSSIPRPKDIIPNSDEYQRDYHSNDVQSETPEHCKSKRARKAKSYGSDFQLYLVEGSRDQI